MDIKLREETTKLKRIWEVDCVSLDAALAGSFDWRELANMLHDFGYRLNPNLEEPKIEIQTQSLVHQSCHDENALSLKIENFLDRIHHIWIESVFNWSTSQCKDFAMTFKWQDKKELAGIFWAFAVDKRDHMECIRRLLHQRYQMVSIRSFEQV